MKGELVILKSVDGRPSLGKIWSIEGDAIYVVVENEYEKMIEGKSEVYPIGFLRKDVYKCGAVEQSALRNFQNDKTWDWVNLQRY